MAMNSLATPHVGSPPKHRVELGTDFPIQNMLCRIWVQKIEGLKLTIWKWVKVETPILDQVPIPDHIF